MVNLKTTIALRRVAYGIQLAPESPCLWILRSNQRNSARLLRPTAGKNPAEARISGTYPKNAEHPAWQGGGGSRSCRAIPPYLLRNQNARDRQVYLRLPSRSRK